MKNGPERLELERVGLFSWRQLPDESLVLYAYQKNIPWMV
jgi:hypothetical protein